MIEYTKYELKDVCSRLSSGKGISAKMITDEGAYPVYGGNGLRGYTDHSNFNGDCAIIGRQGAFCGNVRYFKGEAYMTEHAVVVCANSSNNTHYLSYFLSTMNLGRLSGQSAQPGLSVKTLGIQEIELPPLEYQNKVVALLNSLDEKIAINASINDNLEQQMEAYFLQLFIENADPKWKTGTISDLGSVVGGSTPSKAKPEYYTEDGIAWITPKDLSINKSKFISHGENDITELGLRNSSASIMPRGTVLFSSRAPIGYIAIAAGQVTTNQGFKSVVPNAEIGTPFIYYFLKYNLPVIEGMASGSTFKEVSGSTMKGVPATIPDFETLAIFNSFCAPLFEQQQVLEEENIKLAAIRDSLLPKLMSGEIDVSDIQI